jgi:hypothetical protein
VIGLRVGSARAGRCIGSLAPADRDFGAGFSGGFRKQRTQWVPRERDQRDDGVWVSRCREREGDLSSRFAVRRRGEAAGDLHAAVTLAWRCRHPERLELVARVTDDVAGLDLRDGRALPGLTGRQGSGEFGDPL